MTFKNQSEKLVYDIARRSFLSLWSYANPLKGSKGKELCDVLTMFDTNVAIFSVKERTLQSASPRDIKRWRRRAIEKSAKQIYGAERWIRSASHVVRPNGTDGLPLPPPSMLRIHRIAIALGSQGKAHISSRDYGKGFIHVFDDDSFQVILSELDTPRDLFDYLENKLSFLGTASHVLLEGGEEDLLAFYLANGRVFPTATGVVSVGQGIWDDFSSSPEYEAKEDAEKDSRAWDGLIETITRDALSGNLGFGGSLSDSELALRQMAAEDRFSRRTLGKAFDDFLRNSADSVRSRLVLAPSGITYVFLVTPLDTERQERAMELMARCLVARGKYLDRSTVIGIATEQFKPNQGFSLDLIYLSKPEWTEEDQKAFDAIQSSGSYFQGKTQMRFGQDEYPS